MAAARRASLHVEAGRGLREASDVFMRLPGRRECSSYADLWNTRLILVLEDPAQYSSPRRPNVSKRDEGRAGRSLLLCLSARARDATQRHGGKGRAQGETD